MDEVTFKSDTVLSDVHLYTPNQRHLMVRLNGMGQPVFLSQFKLLWSRDSWTDSGPEDNGPRDVSTQETSPAGSGSGHSHEDLSLQAGDDIAIQEGLSVPLDEDGDLDVVRRPRAASDPDQAEPARDKVHPMILAQEEDDFVGDGAQESCPHSIIKIDVGTDLLAMCQRNVALNSHLTATGDGVIKVKELDWLKDNLCTDPKVPFSWSEEDISDLYDHTTVLFAAEVFYDDDLTDALFNTLSRLVHRLKNACTAILSVEKRFNFTLRHLDVTCEAYDHFRASLDSLEKLADGRLRFMVEPVEASFPQLLIYERIRQLELWKIRVEPAA
ncbi:methyltransferase-like protein 22 isoform X2 [Microtus ochrogaster]|uniref:Methyltransferase-like protein 22 isoform X2 n=1 Tax=Microtus ochrogaster TaxID=79684 RepID=A0ABM1U3X3_MICOH|nr:methyltransferase-like protein 22 isoform X2 [Microtus ochrogaster]